MQRYVSKPHQVLSEKWDGDEHGSLIAALNAKGWVTFVQKAAAGQMVNSYNDEKSQWEPTPAKDRLVIVGPYRKQLYSLDAGQHLQWHDGDSNLHSTDSGPSARDWGVDPDASGLTWPSPTELTALVDIDETAW